MLFIIIVLPGMRHTESPDRKERKKKGRKKREREKKKKERKTDRQTERKRNNEFTCFMSNNP